MSSVDGDEEEDEEEEIAKISLPDRTTRGKRMKNVSAGTLMAHLHSPQHHTPIDADTFAGSVSAVGG